MSEDKVIDRLLAEHAHLSKRHEHFTTPGNGAPAFAEEVRRRLEGIEKTIVELRRLAA